MKKYLKVSILVDNPGSWFNKYLGMVFDVVRKYDPHYSFVTDARDLRGGDVLFMLSCNRILAKEKLTLHKNSIVIHESDLPKGRGWSPMTWQVESGRSDIPVTLFEASSECDEGDYYIKDRIRISSTDLIEDIRLKQAAKTAQLIRRYLAAYPMKARRQKGTPSYYRRRSTKDNEIDINKSIKSQFNKIRVADNERYPAYFRYKGKKFILKVDKD